MVESTLQSKRYSQAVFEIALERDELDIWQKDLEWVAVLVQFNELVSVMENPKISFGGKAKLLDNLLKGIRPLSLNLIYILTNQGKFSLITEVLNEYQQLMDNYHGIEKAEVTTAVPLNDAEKSKLAQRLGVITGKKIVIIDKVDPALIGGVTARVGGKIIDGSTSSQLAALKNELTGISV